VIVRPYLQAIQQLDYGLLPPNGEVDADGVMLVNARVVPQVGIEKTLATLTNRLESAVIIDPEDDVVVAARITKHDIQTHEESLPATDAPTPLIDSMLALAKTLPTAEEKLDVFYWPHDVIQWHMKEMPAAMNWRLKHGEYTETSDGIFVRPGVQIGEYPSVNTDEGPILLDEDVHLGPFCFLSGPVYAGPRTRVIEHAALKDGVALGHTVKIGGEVEASVIESFTNKQHHGFLGHSYLGSWINLGAGTCNSDLKNTYGTIKMEYGSSKVSTGMQFLGCVIGDYSKTAINTSIFTGKVIGVCSMLYGFATSNVPSFVNYARLFGQTAPLPADVMVNTQARMFARRKVQQRDCDIQLILDMYEQTSSEREAVDQYAL
jgi:glucose-1-phosphate thymidylyltransferase